MRSDGKTCNKCKSVIHVDQHDPLKVYCNTCYELIRVAIFYDGQKDYSKFLNTYKKHTALYSYTES